MGFDVSIIVPFKDEVKMLKRLLDAILTQKTQFSFEVIILDSSKNNYHNYLKFSQLNLNWVIINPESFNHGLTRNVGVEASKGKVLIFTVQDATPFDENWMSNLVEPILNSNLDAVCGVQMPNPKEDTNPTEWYRPIEKPSLKTINISFREFNKLSSIEKSHYTGWDNVNSAYSKTALQSVPFREMMFGEDAQWAVDAINNGLTIGFTGFSIVYHYHSFSIDFNIKRTLAEYYTRKVTIGLNPIRPKLKFWTVLSWMKSILFATRNPCKIIYWLNYNYKIFTATRTAYNIWLENGIYKIEDFLIKNVPLAVDEKR